MRLVHGRPRLARYGRSARVAVLTSLPCTNHPVVGVQEQVEVSPLPAQVLYGGNLKVELLHQRLRASAACECAQDRVESCCGARSSCGWMRTVCCGERVVSWAVSVLWVAYGGDPGGYRYVGLEARLAVCGAL